MNIGFIGLGKMGFPIAANISKKYNTFVYNRTTQVSISHSEQYNTACINSIHDIFNNAEIVLMCLPTHNEVNKIIEEGIFNASENDGNSGENYIQTKIIIDCTSSEPIFQKKMCEKLYNKGITYFDSPVSGGPTKAELGTLTSMVGGDEEKYQIIKDVLNTFSDPIYVGMIGNGCAIKAINNIMNVSNLCIAAEGISALESLGISKETALTVINKSSGRSLMTQERIPVHIMEKNYNYGFSLGLMKKDVLIAMSIIKNLRMCSKILEIIDDGIDSYGPNADYTEVTKNYFNPNKKLKKD